MNNSEQLAVSSKLVKTLLFTTAYCLLLTAHAIAADPTAARLFFSDANISFTYPNHWNLQTSFPYGPLFTKKTQDGSTAMISCAISAPVSDTRLTSDIPPDTLKQLAQQGLETSQPGYKAISQKDQQLQGHNLFEMTWENTVGTTTLRHQSDYFYVENRVYALTLQTSPKTFRWLQPDFSHWLMSLRILSRKDAGSLADPAHGGLWIHQTGGLKVLVPDSWLIAVSDDRTLGTTLAQGAAHLDITATVDASSGTVHEFSRRDKKEAVKAVRKKGLRIVRNHEDAFHGYLAYYVEYEGMLKDRLVKGTDIWVLSPKGRWLFNVEGDVSLYNSLTEQIQQILNAIEFI